MSLIRSIAAIVSVGIAYALLMFVVHLPPSYSAAASVAVALLGLGVVAWALMPERWPGP